MFLSHWSKAVALLASLPRKELAWPWLPGTWPCMQSSCLQHSLAALHGEPVIYGRCREEQKLSFSSQIINPAPFFLNLSPGDEELRLRWWFYPLTTNNNRSIALVVFCHTWSQQTVASSLFLSACLDLLVCFTISATSVFLERKNGTTAFFLSPSPPKHGHKSLDTWMK